MPNAIGISVIMPTYNQVSFIARAIKSLLNQSFRDWELIIVNDGSTDNTENVVKEFLQHDKIIYLKNQQNQGLGFSMNRGLDAARNNFIAYLPSDDIYYKDHLLILINLLRTNRQAIMACSGTKSVSYANGSINFFYEDIPDTGYQPVQVLHKKRSCKWLERSEFVTDCYTSMYWAKLIGSKARVVNTMTITSEWVSHPFQRHRILSERYDNGIHYYRQYYGVKEPLKFQSTFGNALDEKSELDFSPKAQESANNHSLKIVIAGELSFNADRINVLEQNGHQLYGIWIDGPGPLNAVGPLPFGKLEDIPVQDCEKRLQQVKPDIIYGLLGNRSIPLVHYLLNLNLDIPVVWHYSGSISEARRLGLWPFLTDLFCRADGYIYNNIESKIWFKNFLLADAPDFILNGDLPHHKCLRGIRASLLSVLDGELHTVLLGEPVGLSEIELKSLADQKIHLHFYGTYHHNLNREWISCASDILSHRFHLHENCPSNQWVSEFSKYDAGWLPIFESSNYGELNRIDDQDLALPVEISIYGVAGLPMIIRNNNNHIVAVQSYLRKHSSEIAYDYIENLSKELKKRNSDPDYRNLLWKKREEFCFNNKDQFLINFFHKVIQTKVKSDVTGNSQIPKVIHQTWKNDAVPNEYSDFVETWKTLHPEWTYVLWTDEKNREFIGENYPEFLWTYDNYPLNIQRVDAARYFILYHHGGMFVDLDYACQTNIEVLLEGESVVLGSEPEEHCKKFGKNLIVSNAFMAATKNNSFFKYVIDMISILPNRREKTLINVLESTGPFVLTRFFESYRGKEKVTILPAGQICPLTVWEARHIRDNDCPDIKQKLEKAYAVHHFHGNWWLEFESAET